MYVDYDADKVRPILHVYFIVAFLVLGIIGQECCKLVIKASLRRGRQVPLHRMTGWVSGFSFFTSTFELRNIPGGLLFGFIMLWVTVLSPINTIIIGALVTNVQVSTRCEFGQGMVSNTTGPLSSTGPHSTASPSSSPPTHRSLVYPTAACKASTRKPTLTPPSKPSCRTS
jgi:hypothetical protein